MLDVSHALDTLRELETPRTLGTPDVEQKSNSLQSSTVQNREKSIFPLTFLPKSA